MPARYLLGLILLLLGVGFLVDQFYGMNLVAVWWPLLIVLAGVNQLIRYPSRPWWALFLIALGVLLQARNLAVLPANLWVVFGAVLLVMIGVRLLLPERRRPVTTGRTTPTRVRAGDNIDRSVTFWGAEVYSDSPQFRGGTLNAVFGGLEVDLRRAQLADEGAVLEISVVFGGVVIKVPEDWPVAMAATSMLGACENNARRVVGPDAPAPKLLIRCQTTLGGVEVKH